MTSLLCPKFDQNLPGGVLPEKLSGGVRYASWNPYPILDEGLWFSLPFLRRDQKSDTLFQTWSPGARRVIGALQPRPQGAFPWLWRWGHRQSHEPLPCRPGHEVAERVTSCCGPYTVVGVNITREMVLSPNDEEVANSSKKHTQFKTRVHKPYPIWPISDQNGRNWYRISDQNS